MNMTPEIVAETLEGFGYYRSIAGEADFNAVIKAVGRMINERKGVIIIFGDAGTGKTKIAEILAACFCRRPLLRFDMRNAVSVNLSRALLKPEKAQPIGYYNVLFDAVGEERPIFENKIEVEVVRPLTHAWIENHCPLSRLIITTRITEPREFDARYGTAWREQIKKNCVMVWLKGPDKRQFVERYFGGKKIVFPLSTCFHIKPPEEQKEEHEEGQI